MTEFDIQKVLIERFNSLNDFSNIELLKKDENKNIINVHYPNKAFSVPSDNRWYNLNFISNEPVDSAILDNSQNRFTGVFYIDIYSPIDVEEFEVENKYKWIAKLFTKYTYIDDVVIKKCYINKKESDAENYRVQVAINWEADIDKE